MTEVFGQGVNMVTGEYSRGASGFWIENGELAYPVSEVTIASNLKDMFLRMVPASDLDRNFGTASPDAADRRHDPCRQLTKLRPIWRAIWRCSSKRRAKPARSRCASSSRSPEVWMKGGTSPVSEADYAVDRFLRETLLAARPDYGWLSEETADSAAQARRPAHLRRRSDRRHARLPRGTARLVRLYRRGRSRAADRRRARMPGQAGDVLGGLGQAARSRTGRGWRSASRGRSTLIGGPKPMIDAAAAEMLRATSSASHYVPSLAYRLAMVADGALDATFVKPNSHDWDLAAADLILREAGGALLDEHGSAPAYGGQEIRHGALVAGSGELLAMMAAASVPVDRRSEQRFRKRDLLTA